MASSIQEREELELLRLRKKKALTAQQAAPTLDTPPAEQRVYAKQGQEIAAQGGLTLGPEPRNPMAGAGEVAASVGSGALSFPLSGLAGLAGNAVDIGSGSSPHTGANWQQAVQQALTYQPRTLEGQVGTTILGAGPMALNKVADWAGGGISEATGMPSLGAAVNTGINTIPMWGPALANKLGPSAAAPTPMPAPTTPQKGVPLGSIRQPQNAVRMETFKEANQAGYKFPPSQIEESATRGVIESVGGKAALKQRFAKDNQQVTNQIARREAGLGKWQPITKKALKDAREAASGPYKEVAKLYEGANAELQNLKSVRHEAQQAWNMARTGNPDALKLAIDLDKQTAAIETALEATAKQYGQLGLVDRLREARMKIAKNYQVDRATNHATGDVVANDLGAIWEAQGSQGFTGGLLTIAKTSRAFGKFMGDASSIPTPGVGQLQAALAAYGLGEASSGKLGSLANLALWPASGLARKAAGSARLQAPLRSSQGLSLRQLRQIPPGALTPSLGLNVPEEN